MQVERLTGPILAMVATLSVTIVLVVLTIRICNKYGWTANPRSDRWHKGRPCFFGGVPIWIGFISSALVFLPHADSILWKLVATSTLMFALGLVDDIWHLRPRTKLIAQVAAAGWIVHSGLVYTIVNNSIANTVISILWIVGITNAFNLLDNMDGLAAGIALISAVYLVIFFALNAAPAYSLLAILTAGAVAAFLIFNFNPARIFMGDSGSLSLGFLLGACSLLQITHVSGIPAFVFAPALVLAIPVFDTFFVSVTRRLRGQPVSQGGTDHSSHRLVKLGLSERNAVLLLYALSAISGAVALGVHNVFYPRSISMVAVWFLFLLLFGIHLFRVDSTAAVHGHHTSYGIWHSLLNRDSLAFLLDPVVLSLSYYLAYFSRFGRYVPATDLKLFSHSWPIVICLKFICLALYRVYERSWWRGSIRDFFRLSHSVIVGEAVAVLALIALYRFQGFSRAVFVFDAGYSLIFLLLIRKSFVFFRDSLGSWCQQSNSQERRVFVLGTSEHTEVALRFLRHRHIACAGLIDTNGGADVGRWVWGTRVLGGLADLRQLQIRHGIAEVILPEDETVPYSETEFADLCQKAHVTVVKLGLYPNQAKGQPQKKLA